MENKNLPIYKIKVNPDLTSESGVFAISLVDEPAIEVDFFALAKEIEMQFSANKDKQLLYGPLLIPNKLIFRRDDNGNEFNIMFDAETIAIIADKFNENKLGDSFNFQHSNRTVEAVILENWLTGDVDKSSEYGYNLPAGTWFSKVKVKDEQFWMNEVKSEKVKGFSVEIKCDVELLQLNNNKINIKLMEIKTKEGVALYYDGEFAEGTQLFLDEAMTEYAPEGAHMLEDDRVITLDAEGVILSIAEETPELPNEEEIVEEELATEEVVEEVTEEKLALVPEEVMAIVQPVFEAMSNQMAELVNKIGELEAKLNELQGEHETIEVLKAEVIEKLSTIAGVESITKKVNDVKTKKEEVLLSKVNSFRNLLK
jgi:hypothetical protein